MASELGIPNQRMRRTIGPPKACLDVNRSSRIAPHAPHCGLASRRGELVYLDEAEPLVAVVVAPVARFEVCGHALLVQPGQVRGQQAHPLALSAVVWVRTEEGQVPVRPFWGVVRVEAGDKGQHVVRVAPD